MLVLTRKQGESVTLGPDIEIFVTKLNSKQVQLAFKIPDDMRVLRDNAKVTERPRKNTHDSVR